MFLLVINNNLLIQYGIYSYPDCYFDACPLTTYPLVFNGLYCIFTQCLTTGGIGTGTSDTSIAWTVGSAIYWDGTTEYGNYDLKTGFRLGASSGVRNYYIAIGY